MLTYAQLSSAAPALKAAIEGLDTFVKLTVKPVCATTIYYTDGEANGAIANIQFGIKHAGKGTKYINMQKTEVITNDTVYESVYVFDGGKVKWHFVQRLTQEEFAPYRAATEQWLAACAASV